MRPKYYQQCSDLGKKILIASGCPFPEYLDKECFELVNILGSDFYLGNCLKYLWRLGNKNTVIPWSKKKHIGKDLMKARCYLALYMGKEKLEGSWILNLWGVLLNY